MALEEIKSQAEMLATENKKNDPDIQRVYWFPDEHEVRLVELTELIPRSVERRVYPFYFRADPADNLPAPSGVALIRPDEFGKLELPENWGEWSDAVLLAEEESK